MTQRVDAFNISDQYGRYFYSMEHFLRIPIWIVPSSDLEDIINQEPEYIKRMAMIPLESISYMHDGIEKNTTEIVLLDGEIIIAAEKYSVIFGAWDEWYNQMKNSFIALNLRSN
jgi:hypothetical protein